MPFPLTYKFRRPFLFSCFHYLVSSLYPSFILYSLLVTILSLFFFLSSPFSSNYSISLYFPFICSSTHQRTFVFVDGAYFPVLPSGGASIIFVVVVVCVCVGGGGRGGGKTFFGRGGGNTLKKSSVLTTLYRKMPIFLISLKIGGKLGEIFLGTICPPPSSTPFAATGTPYWIHGAGWIQD